MSVRLDYRLLRRLRLGRRNRLGRLRLPRGDLIRTEGPAVRWAWWHALGRPENRRYPETVSIDGHRSTDRRPRAGIAVIGRRGAQASHDEMEFGTLGRSGTAESRSAASPAQCVVLLLRRAARRGRPDWSRNPCPTGRSPPIENHSPRSSRIARRPSTISGHAWWTSGRLIARSNGAATRDSRPRKLRNTWRARSSD